MTPNEVAPRPTPKPTPHPPTLPSTELAPADTTFLSVIAAAARDPQVDIAKMEALLSMMERIKAHEAEASYNKAMRAAQEEMKPVVRDAQNDHTHSRYARLETIDARIRPIYTKHGFSLSFNSGEPRKPENIRVLCDVRHIDGHVTHHELEGALDVVGAKGTSNKTSIQGLGSSVSYLRRYLKTMIFDIVLKNEDNDGNSSHPEVQYISEEQVLQVVDGCHRAGVSETSTQFLAWVGVDKIEHIMPIGFNRVMNELNRRAAAKEAQQ